MFLNKEYQKKRKSFESRCKTEIFYRTETVLRPQKELENLSQQNIPETAENPQPSKNLPEEVKVQGKA